MELMLKKLDELLSYTCEERVNLFNIREKVREIRQDLWAEINKARAEIEGKGPTYGEKLAQVRAELEESVVEHIGSQQEEK